MRTTLIVTAFVALLLAGCMTPGVIPPQPAGEPKSVTLSEMSAEMGWVYQAGPGPYDYTMRSPKGDQVIFGIGSDVININGTRWRQERDAVEWGNGNDLFLPESTFNFVAKHFGQHHLARDGVRTSSVDYELDPITPIDTKPAATVKQPRSDTLKGLTICIDAGHGGTDPGGIANGVQEKHVVLPVALLLRDLCEDASATVIMTRVGDTYPELDQRVNVANKARCDLFVSIHANIAPDSGDVTGFEVFYRGGDDGGEKLSKAIVGRMDAATDSPNRGAKVDPRGLRVLEKTHMPAVLVELGFLSNAGEARRLSDKGYQNKLTDAVFAGIVQHWTKTRASVSK
ncbi:MAG: N-acetylmuramoyl-L-alanine amidase [Planctomycetes bacterium]|nr:N-acetylmuramoyl-L-alanine amidase [Planctomycetota bacterium]